MPRQLFAFGRKIIQKMKTKKKEQCVDMSAAISQIPGLHFLCSICLKVLTDPVSTPCGHNFCKLCISPRWDTSVSYSCPMCQQVFTTRPELAFNSAVSELVSQFRRGLAAPGEDPCDVSTGTEVKALKPCLDCGISYCEIHLEPHLTASGLTRHQLVEPVENLETWMCPKHSKRLEMFCKNDQTCVCLKCCVAEHNSHQFGSLKEESEERKVELQQTIQNRRDKLEEIRELARISKITLDREEAEGVKLFTALKELFQRDLKEMMEMIEEQQESKRREAEGLIKDLEEEISELTQRRSERAQHPGDNLHVLQDFDSFLPATKDWTDVIVRLSSYEAIVLRVGAQLIDTVSDKMEEMKMKRMKEKEELKMMKQFAVDVTLDPLTAHNNLNISDDGKQVDVSDVRKKVPDNKERFDPRVYVLGKQSFSSGKFYFEVQVKGKTDWTLGVVKKSIKRKGHFTLRAKNGSWVVILRDGNKYEASEWPPVILDLNCVPEKVGVFVDYEGGVISFYDVDAAALIHSFTNCRFTGKLCPLFGPCSKKGGKKAAPLIICPVNQSE
ncbi:E3 ubiquitin-protein ligase TRIM21-like [Gouania willdenowi]|uniref:E3 ubiquitin-protein ligase TRIM21-like n=1 Tax=Gouania willdenowi TaxID=441366 RepID=A0A8C5ED71_GOUWI|nr:E3 ubiquitin-protein ligase TRIM21-like [Gouania willdenowi]